jgi:hypothetical protein
MQCKEVDSVRQENLGSEAALFPKEYYYSIIHHRMQNGLQVFVDCSVIDFCKKILFYNDANYAFQRIFLFRFNGHSFDLIFCHEMRSPLGDYSAI